MREFILTYERDHDLAYLYVNKDAMKPWKTKERKDGLLVDRSPSHELAGIEILYPTKFTIKQLMDAVIEESNG